MPEAVGFERSARITAFHDGLYSDLDFTNNPFASIAFDESDYDHCRRIREEIVELVVEADWYKDYGLTYKDLMEMDFQEIALFKRRIMEKQKRKAAATSSIIDGLHDP